MDTCLCILLTRLSTQRSDNTLAPYVVVMLTGAPSLGSSRERGRVYKVTCGHVYYRYRVTYMHGTQEYNMHKEEEQEEQEQEEEEEEHGVVAHQQATETGPALP